jgi:N utilization substance protein A
MNKELIEALDALEKEKDISKDVLIEAIENSLIQGCKQQFEKADNVKVKVDRETGDFFVYAEKTVVEEVEDAVEQISLGDAIKINSGASIGDIVNVEIKSKEFSRIAAKKAKDIILQKIREEEKRSVYNEYSTKQDEIVTGVVQRINGDRISVNLGRMDTVLLPKDQVPGEVFMPTERIKLLVTSVNDNEKGVMVRVSRNHPNLVRRLFESEVTEVRDGTVEIKEIVREAGSRTKMAVYSNNPDVDPVGACVGMNGARVNAIVSELRGEKIDIINWSANSAELIENALSPAKVISVIADDDAKTAQVVVPDYQLSLAIGKEGQNARLAARLTHFKIDIKSETQATESGLYNGQYTEGDYSGEDYGSDEYGSNEVFEDGAYDGEAYNQYEE